MSKKQDMSMRLTPRVTEADQSFNLPPAPTAGNDKNKNDDLWYDNSLQVMSNNSKLKDSVHVSIS